VHRTLTASRAWERFSQPLLEEAPSLGELQSFFDLVQAGESSQPECRGFPLRDRDPHTILEALPSQIAPDPWRSAARWTAYATFVAGRYEALVMNPEA
jgi:hypothetical protein